ncbi:MAG: hypothetical protein A2Y40_07950 [Candidatus Margulisbacteria bacterium GWF2_35_9]|nr:MAG: hypothetical protein A2Y40_07950 [Candidatus Margulisbacteria bacterium GWF2_35_9]
MGSNNLQINQIALNNQSDEVAILNEDTLFSELDTIFNNLQDLIPGQNNKQKALNFNSQSNVNEMKSFEEEVLYVENKDIVKDKTEYLANLELDRIQKLRQKELLVKIGQERLSAMNEGKEYTRGMDEGVLLNTNKKDHMKVVDKEESAQSAMKEESIGDIVSVSEELNEEFINNNRTFMSQSQSDELDKKEKKDSKKVNKNEKQHQLEEDEFLLVTLTGDEKNFISKFNSQINEIENNSKHNNQQEPNKEEITEDTLLAQIERRISRIAPVIDRKGPRLKPSLQKTKAISNLRKKFNKNH